MKLSEVVKAVSGSTLHRPSNFGLSELKLENQ